MKFFVLGATGATGGLFLDRALSEGHQVTAYVRDPGKLAPRDGLTVLAGDVLYATALTSAMAGADAVVSMLGLSSPAPNGFSEKAVDAIATAAKHTGTKRVLIMSAFGVGDSVEKASWIAKLMYKGGGRAIYADKAAGEKILTSSSLDWTLAYPVLLTNGPRTTTYRALDLAEVTRLPGLPRISRADVADFLLAAAQEVRWIRNTAVLTSAVR